MATPQEGPGRADVREVLAEERTFLAWIRTSLALMGFGFVVARFGPAVTAHPAGAEVAPLPSGPSLWLGTAFIVVGVLMNLLAVRRHVRLVAELNRGEFAQRGSSPTAVMLALFLAVVGLGIAIHLVWA